MGLVQPNMFLLLWAGSAEFLLVGLVQPNMFLFCYGAGSAEFLLVASVSVPSDQPTAAMYRPNLGLVQPTAAMHRRDPSLISLVVPACARFDR